ncbi:hypothetical protein LPJ72_002119 [Coemansia sp. Benny D160-2]|nr:hypothetical protein LPJ72_002119 [Coemansia sp. Benny D160-2]
MPQSKVDCYFFMTGTCRNGESCGFRHSTRARESQDVCQSFAQTGDCPEEDCGKRHTEKSAARTTKPPSEVPCRNEESGGTCTRADCIFKHSKPHDSGGAKGAGVAGGAGVGAGRPMMTAFRPPRKEASAPNAPSSRKLNAGAKPFFAPHPRPQNRPKVFGDLVWTPGGGSSTSLAGGGASGTNAQPGQQLWQQPQRIPAASAFAVDGGFPKTPSAESDGMDVDSAYTADDTMGSVPPTELTMQPSKPTDQITRGAFAPAQQASVVESAPAATAAAKIPTIYDILGIAEDTSDDNQVDHRRREGRMNIPPTNYSEHTFASNPIANNTSSFFHTHAAEPASNDRAQQPQPVDMPQKSFSEPSSENYQSSRGNSPASRVCYASEFASYAVGMEENEYMEQEKTDTQPQNNSTNPCTGSGDWDKAQDKPDDLTLGPSITIEDVTDKDKDEGKVPSSSSSPSIEVVQPAEITTPVSEVAAEDVKEQRSRPKSRSVVSDSGKEQGLPKILSFQEIMERKRRKKAAEAAAAAAAAAKSSDDDLAGQQNEGPTGVSKRRVSDDNDNIGDDKGMESDASEGKRRKPDTNNGQLHFSTPKAKNYVAMFEKELEDLSFGLSGPLQNSPASDRISRANINDGYEDADLSQLLGS